MSELALAIDGSIAEITLRREPQRNALTPALFEVLRQTIGDVAGRGEVKVITLRGEGPHFCAGADLAAPWPDTADALIAEGHCQRQMLMQCPKFTIVAVRGAVIGAGCELALSADMVIADETAFLRLPEFSMNTLPIAGSVGRLVGLVGRFRAAEILVSGRRVGAAEALDLGLVSAVVAPDALDAAVRAAAETVAARPLAVITSLKEMLRDADVTQAPGRLDRERELSAVVFEAAMKGICDAR